MDFSEIARIRFYQQGLTPSRFDDPVSVVAWNGAVQSQDYAGAKWAVAQRLNHFVSEAAMDQAFNEGKLIRTHIMRPTWHFVAPQDIRWLLALTAPRVHAASAYYYRAQGLDDRLFAKSEELFTDALSGGKHLTRTELGNVLTEAGIELADLRLSYIVSHAELEGVLCSGPRRGKQFTYALLEERVPPTPAKDRDEALVELVTRYFISHGPALIKDFTWWSGLTVADTKKGIALAGDRLRSETLNNQIYWMAATLPTMPIEPKSAFLLPNYDEALASYTDYSAATTSEHRDAWKSGDLLFSHYAVIDSVVVGTWKRTLYTNRVAVEFLPFGSLSQPQIDTLTAAAERFGQYLDLTVTVSFS